MVVCMNRVQQQFPFRFRQSWSVCGTVLAGHVNVSVANVAFGIFEERRPPKTACRSDSPECVRPVLRELRNCHDQKRSVLHGCTEAPQGNSIQRLTEVAQYVRFIAFWYSRLAIPKSVCSLKVLGASRMAGQDPCRKHGAARHRLGARWTVVLLERSGHCRRTPRGDVAVKQRSWRKSTIVRDVVSLRLRRDEEKEYGPLPLHASPGCSICFFKETGYEHRSFL